MSLGTRPQYMDKTDFDSQFKPGMKIWYMTPSGTFSGTIIGDVAPGSKTVQVQADSGQIMFVDVDKISDAGFGSKPPQPIGTGGGFGVRGYVTWIPVYVPYPNQ